MAVGRPSLFLLAVICVIIFEKSCIKQKSFIFLRIRFALEAKMYSAILDSGSLIIDTRIKKTSLIIYFFYLIFLIYEKNLKYRNGVRSRWCHTFVHGMY